MENLFFELIQVAIGTRDCFSKQPSAEEWYALFEMAKKQSLVGICFAGVQKLYNANANHSNTSNLSKLQYLTWMGLAAKIQQRNQVVNQRCIDLQSRLTKDGFRSFIMKGQGNAVLYRDNRGVNHDLPNLRQSGDIDVYLEGGLDKVLNYAQSFGNTNSVNELEMHVNVFQDTEVEFHYRPFIMRSPRKNKVLQNFFATEFESCYSNMVSLPNCVGFISVPTTEFNLIHQLTHIYLHLYTGGIGIRQLMDYYFVLKTLSGPSLNGESVENVKAVVKKEVSELELDKFASALMWVISHIFEDDKEKDFILWDPNKKDGEFLLKEIMLSGNFGKHDERIKGIDNSKWKSFWIVNGKFFRLARFDRTMWFWAPLWRIYHFAWRKMNGFE